ncbi:folylpolyglutamate synthase [Humulus lupulus]|uniref:folylpolyglutamate synthase n=1 Tax=Humulus lupulus TaxID=3486 RepID=UPI002B40C75E|nr:folylpolyglutamate synthase [Humulus lupulus]XP_062117918.1 folylpolyglutamate synthase [Humulus lupulus]
MYINTNAYLTSGIFGVSYLLRRNYSSIYEITWRPTACLSLDTLKGCGVRYRKVSSQVMEKFDSNGSTKEYVDDLHLASSYESAMEALSSLITGQKRGQKSSIPCKYEKMERMTMYLKILGLEEHIAGLKIIHVAGTKGKGSTCTFCEAILRECGVRTGLFTSPHLIDVRERFRINGLEITEDMFLQHFWECWHKLEENITEDLPMPPLFQFLTVLAFKIFISEQVDVAIVEVGIGGKLDSTNVIKEPVVCGITSLGMDHTETLGNTLSEIASHKAGIFKPKIPAFTVSQLSEAMDVIRERAYELEVPLKVAPTLDPKKLKGLKLSLSGDHQLINAGLAVSLCKCWLQKTGNWEKLTKNGNLEADLPHAFRRGLATAHISGRAQIIHDTSSNSNVSEGSRGDLIFYLDGAHSPESVEACAKWFSSSIKENEHSSVSSYKLEKMDRILRNGHLQHENEFGSCKISKQILLFNCMDLRDPQILLPRLANTCASSGTYFSKALFVPSMSAYNKVTSGASAIPSGICKKDLSWQFNLQRIWEKIVQGKEVDAASDKGLNIDNAKTLPREFIYQDAYRCSTTDNYIASSAVMPSLPLAIKWLRDCVKENPSLRLQVLVTGSLHLVGDVLKVLRR